MMDNGDVREDLRVPEGDLGKEIESKFAAGEEMLVSAPVWTNAFSPLAAYCHCNPLIVFCVWQVTVLSAMGEESAVAVKPMTK